MTSASSIKDNIAFILLRANRITVYNIFRISVDERLKKIHVDCILVLVNSTYKISSVLRTAFTPCVTIYNHNNKAQYMK